MLCYTCLTPHLDLQHLQEIHSLLLFLTTKACLSAGLVGTAYTAIFIILSAAKTGLQGKAFYLGPKNLQSYFLGTNVSTLPIAPWHHLFESAYIQRSRALPGYVLSGSASMC